MEEQERPKSPGVQRSLWPLVLCPHLGSAWGEGGHTHRPASCSSVGVGPGHRSCIWWHETIQKAGNQGAKGFGCPLSDALVGQCGNTLQAESSFCQLIDSF